MNRQKHKLSRRILAVLLMAAMLITMLPSAMFAQDGQAEGQTPVAVNNGSGEAQESVKAVSKDGITINKSVAPTDNGYELTLEAYASEQISTEVAGTAPLDIVLVLDQSGSMANPFSQGETRRQALQNAARGVVDSVRDNGGANHRIGIVTFDNNAETLGQGFTAVSSEGAEQLKTSIDWLSADGATRVDRGLEEANDLLNSARSDAQKIVIVFTDGDPTSGNSFENEVAADAINTAYTIKQDKGATIYTIGIFSGADPNSDSKSNNYMNAMSSNYPKATAEGSNPSIWNLWQGKFEITWNGEKTGSYYLAASDSEELNAVFEQIYEEIGGLASNPTAESVLSDTLSQYFVLPARTDEDDITVEYVEAARYNEKTGFTFEQSGKTPEGITVTINGKTIKVTGFDYKKHVASAKLQADGSYAVTGGKLVVKIPIELDSQAINGTGVYPTNNTDENKAGLDYFDKDGLPTDLKLDKSPSVAVTAYTVTYDWGDNAPTGDVFNEKGEAVDKLELPVDNNKYVPGQSYTVDSKYTSATEVYTKDEYGNLNAKYTFSGWTDPGNGVMDADGVTVTGEWTKTEVAVSKNKVTYDWGDNAPTGDVFNEKGEAVDKLELPVDNNKYVPGQSYTVDSKYTSATEVYTKDEYGNLNAKYTFSGWTDPGNGVMDADGVTVTGEWTKTEVAVSKNKVTYDWGDNAPTGDVFNEKGEAVDKLELPVDNNKYVPGQSYTVDSKYTSATEVYTKDEYGNLNAKYTFSGWTDPGNGVMDADGVTVTGEWTKTEVAVSKNKVTYDWGDNAPTGDVFNEKGEAVDKLELPVDNNKYVPGQSYTVDSKYTSATEVYTKDEYGNLNAKYTFSGWTDPGNGVMDADGVIITGSWTKEDIATYRVIYEMTGLPDSEVKLYNEEGKDVGRPTAPTDNQKYAEGATYGIDDEYKKGDAVYTRDELGNLNAKYTFSGWILDGKEVIGEGVMGTKNIVLKGNWEKTPIEVSKYTVTYNANGGTGTITDENSPYPANSDVTILEDAGIVRDGYTFVNWNTKADGTGETYSPGDVIEKIAASLTLYAQWKENPKYISGFTKEVLTQDEIAALDVEGTYDNPVNKGDKVLVEENGSATFLYKLTVKGDPGASFKITDPGAVLVKANIEIVPGTQNVFDGEIPENGSEVVLYVSLKHENIAAGEKQLWNKAEIISDKINEDVDPDPVVPVDIEVIPTPDFEKLVKDAVQVDCITEEVDHGSKDPATYDLIKDAYTVTGSGAHYEISISADQANYYIAQYNKDVEPDHVYDNMPNGNTIILNYKGNGEWEIQKTPIVIAVRCAAPDDVTAFDKNVITSNDVDNLPDDVKSRTDYVVPAYNNGKIETVTVPKNGTVTLLYVIKVEGSEGTAFTVSDPGANLVYSAYDVTEGDNDTFTGTISKDGSATFYVTRTFTSDEVGAEAEGMLRNSASITVDDGTVKEDEKDEDEDVPAGVGPETDVVKVTPADVTIYEGGKGGYDAVGENSANSNSLPHPMFYIYTPDGVNADGLTFGNGEKTWTAVYDGKDAEGNPLYHFTEGEGQDPVRVTYTYVDPVTKVETTVLADDLDELDNVTDVYTYLRIDLYAGDNNLETVKANVNGVGYAIDTASGRLTVRAVEADDPNTVTSDIQETAPTEDRGTAVAVEPENTTYTFNDTEVVLPADSQPSLLFDNIINDEGTNRTAALEDKADQKLNANDGDYNYEIMYLDLVDANNGNAWIKSSAGTDIYWDYPEGTDRNTDFEVLHFKGLHREGEKSGFDINDLNTITMDEIENVTIEKTDDYIVFHVKEANFSPYALAWEDDSGQDWPPYYPWHPDGDDDGPSGLNTEDHFSYVVGYAEDYRTGEATDDEDLWPVKPNNQITRAEVATIFYRLLEDEVRDEYDTTTNDFSDVTADSWYNQTVSTLARMGIVKGYEDGTFRPNAPITRAEFGAIATRFFAETGATYEPGTFTDVTGNEWFANAIQDAVNLGLIGGYPDGTVRPNNNITRAEACAIVNRTLGRVPDADHLLPEDVMKVWPDNNPTDWFYADMQEATNGHEYAWIEEDGHEIEEWTNLLDKDWTDR